MKDLKVLGTQDNIYHGTFNDISYDSNNELNMIEFSSKLKQDMTKILLTEITTHKVYSGYGCNLQKLINTNIQSFDVKKEILNSVIYAFTYFNNINDSMDVREQIKEIVSIDIRFNVNDPRQIYLRIEVMNKNNDTMTLVLGG